MTFNKILLDVDLNKKQFSNNLFLHEMCKQIGISRTTRNRIAQGFDITMDVFLKCLVWLGKDVKRYIN